MKKYSCILIFFILLLSGCSNEEMHEKKELRAEKGEITVHSKDLSNDTLVSLKGEWIFYWQQLLDPHEIEPSQQLTSPEFIEVPGVWEDETGSMIGQATYTLTVKVPDIRVGQVMGFYIPHQYSSYDLWADGEHIASNGKVGIDKGTSSPAFRKELAFFTPNDPEIQLTMQIANYEHPTGGANRKILFGTADAITTYYSELVASTLFVIGGILVMGIYQIGIFIFRRHEKAFMYFGILSILIAARALFVEPLFITVLFPEFSWIWQHRIEILITYIAYSMYLLFLGNLYPKEMSSRVMRVLIGLSAVLFVVTIFTEPLLYLPVFNSFLVVAFLTIIYTLFVLVMAVRKRRPTSIINLTASILFFITVINDALVSLDWIEGFFIATYGFFLYILVQSINLSRNYARKFQESELLTGELRELNLSLDEKIQARTEQLEAMNEKLHELTILDGLTGLYNRRFFDEKMEEMADESERSNEPLTLLLIDLDEFKKYNDKYGHVLGDKLIKLAGSLFREVVGNSGYVARYGGEEFAVILPNCVQEQGNAIAEEIRFAMVEANCEHLGNPPSNIATLSIGGTSSSLHSHKVTEDWLKFADRGLYKSKENGKNCVTML